MTTIPKIVVACGGVSKERAVSLGSGQAVAEGMRDQFNVEMAIVDEEVLPDELDPESHVVFSTLHGTFGEDGGFQRLLEEKGIEFVGCDSASSRLTFDKSKTKAALARMGIPVLDEIVFHRDEPPDCETVFSRLGDGVVLKPVDEGSSLGLAFAHTPEELAALFDSLTFDRWMLETRVEGREISVGVVEGEALEIVEIQPKSGRYDFESKYTKGMTDFIVPANLPGEMRDRVKSIVEDSYRACGCRDYARVDLMIDGLGHAYVLELNTIPGMKETSLLPMSASGVGLNFKAMLKKIAEPAFLRFHNRYSIC